MTEFQRFIKDLIRLHGTASAVADGVGMTVSAFSRGVRNENTLSEEHCLRLAEFAGESPIRVLRLAGKTNFADLVERQFGPPREPLADASRYLIALPIEVQLHLWRLVDGLRKSHKK